MAPTTYVYDQAGRVTSTTKGVGTSYTCFDSEGLLLKAKAPGDAQETTYTYDPAGAQRTAADAHGTVTTDYDEAGRTKRSVDSLNSEALFSYDREGNLTRRIADAGPSSDNYPTEYSYDAEGKLTRLTDPANQGYRFDYDSRGNLRATWYEENHTFSWNDYNAAGWPTAVYNRHGDRPGTLPDQIPDTTAAPQDQQGSPLADFAYTYELDGKKTQEVRSHGGGAGISSSGDLITDAVRSAGVQGDGRPAPDSSSGIWEGTTNLLPNGGLESNNWWWNLVGVVGAQTSTNPKFGTKAHSARSAAASGDNFIVVSGFNLQPSTTYTWSAWVYFPQAGYLGENDLYLQEIGGAYRRIAVLGPGLRAHSAGWHRLSGTGTTPSDWIASSRVALRPAKLANGNWDTNLTIYFDGLQVEQKTFSTPYVHTDGAQAARTPASAQAAASALNKDQGWIAIRTRLGWSSTSDPASTFWSWGQIDAGVRNELTLVWSHQNNNFNLQQFANGAQTTVSAPPQTHQPGQLRTIIAAWTQSPEAKLKISIDGAPFTTTARPSVAAITSPSLHLGRSFDGGSHANSDLLWVAAGTGLLGDANASQLHALGNSDPTFAQLPGQPTLAWDGKTFEATSATQETTSYVYDELGRLSELTLPNGTVRRYLFDLDSNRTQITENGQEVAFYTYEPTQTPGVDQLTSVREGGPNRTDSNVRVPDLTAR